MQIEFRSPSCDGRQEVEAHIQSVYADVYGATVTQFAPLLVSARSVTGQIMAAAGIRTSEDGFFSDCYLDGGLDDVVSRACGLPVAEEEIMEVVSLAATSPFPVLPMLDHVVSWGRRKGKTCGLFTATAPLRHLLGRTGMPYATLGPALRDRVADPDAWGSYYDTDPQVCVFSEVLSLPRTLSPRTRLPRSEAS